MFVKMNLILPFSQVLDHMAPGLFFEIPTPLTPQLQSISLLSVPLKHDSLPATDSSFLPCLQAFT